MYELIPLPTDGGAALSGEAITSTAETRDCDLILMASRGRRGFAGPLPGGGTMHVPTHRKIPVLVCR